MSDHPEAAENGQVTAEHIDENPPVSSIYEPVKHTAPHLSADASRAFTEAGRSMRTTAYMAKEKASDSLLNAADSLRAEALKTKNEELIRQAQTLSRGMEKTALYLDSRTLEQMGEDATEVVRANVWQTLGVAFLVGLVMGLWLNSGGRRH